MVHLQNSAFVFLIVGLISVAGYAGSSPLDGHTRIRDDANVLIPLKLGNKWVVRFYHYDTSGVVVTSFLDSFSVKKDTIIDNEKWYSLIGLKPADLDTRDWYTNRSDGIWVWRGYPDSIITCLAFKFPTMPGDSWRLPDNDSTKTISTSEVVSNVSPADTCIHFEDHLRFSRLGDVHYYVVPNRGFVKFEEYAQTKSGRLYVIAGYVLVRAILN